MPTIPAAGSASDTLPLKTCIKTTLSACVGYVDWLRILGNVFHSLHHNDRHMDGHQVCHHFKIIASVYQTVHSSKHPLS